MRQILGFVLVLSLSGILANVVRPSIKAPVGIAPAGIFEDLVNTTIYDLIANISDPITIDDTTINFDEDEDQDLITGTASISGFELSGISGLEIPFLQVEIIGFILHFDIVLPRLEISTGYKLDVTVADALPLYGDGSLDVTLKNVNISGSGQADFSDGLSVQNLTVHVHLGDATFNIKGLLDDEDFSTIVSHILNDIAVSFVNEHDELVSGILSGIVDAVISAILGGGDDTGDDGLSKIYLSRS